MKIICILIIGAILLIGIVYAQGIDFSEFKVKVRQDTAAENVETQGFTGASTKCGVKPSLPSGWRIVKDEPNSLDAQGPLGMWLAIVMNDYGDGFPIEASLNAYKDTAIKEKSTGKLTDWQERVIDGVRGIQRVEAAMPLPSDPRRITWIGYKGIVGINIVASSKSRDFDSCLPALNEVVGSLRW